MSNIFLYGERELSYLSERDGSLAAAIKKYGFIERMVFSDFFTAFVNTVAAQQISSKALESVWGKLCALLPEMTAENVLEKDDEALRSCGLSVRKISWIKGGAEKIKSGKLDTEELSSLPDDELCARLCTLGGIGVWSAEMLMIFALGRKDVLSFGDFGINRGLCVIHGLAPDEKLTKAEFAQYKALYSPFGTIASFYLWAASANEQAK